MKPAGLASFKLRQADRSKIYSHENDLAKLPPGFVKQFKANKKAWNFFKIQAPSYQKVIIHWITTAKQEVTQLKRLDKAIKESELLKRVL
ncbi:MAG: YdeI/OmpD-associated family protein [Ferruginibacter sp.]